ncbi:MAG: hypothetical protein ACI9TH_001993 [Kiritimatiellia bacterium]|jgi:hypothetical protein
MPSVRRGCDIGRMNPCKTAGIRRKWSMFLRLAMLALMGCGAILYANESVAAASAHWAFQPLVAKPVPDVDKVPLPLDRFIRARWAERKLTAAPRADRRILIRRMSFDLTGLPPTVERVEAFVKDPRPDAVACLIDELLDSPRYGERWGRYWLDLARYADTAGENSDYPIPEAYRYRDYVIDAFNQDTPYDVFVREQLAGDILAKDTVGKRYETLVVATGFISQAKRFGTHKLEDMHLIIEDTLQTMGQTVMGMTLRCARCHDHKYDPISMEDYYGLYGFFEHTAYPFPGGEEVKQPSQFVPLIPAAELVHQDAAWSEAHADDIRAAEAAIEQAGEEVERITSEQSALQAELTQSEQVDELALRLQDRLQFLASAHEQAQKVMDREKKQAEAGLEKLLAQKPSRGVPLAYAVQEGPSVETRVHKLGNPKTPGANVARGVPRALGGTEAFSIAEGASGRLELAHWLTHPDHPLTARVMVNRIWQHHFGKALVATPSDFGLQGELPTHPALLDWLALAFVERGWSIKAMHRLIMQSETYQQSNAACAEDPENQWYTRFDRQRLDAEAIRDSLLAVSGELDLTRPGPHPFPPKDQWKFTAHHQFKAVYPSRHRSVFLMVQRLHPHPYLALFDGANTSESTAVRGQSTVASQALFMANSDFVHARARAFAQRVISGSSARRARIERAYGLAFSRSVSAAEMSRSETYLDRYAEVLVREQVPDPTLEAWTSIARTLLAANEFIYVD